MATKKIFIIGIDGGTWDILDPLIVQNKMPHLSKLKDEGSWGILNSTIPPVTAPAWASFQTGVNSGKHGVYEFNEYKVGSYNTTFVNSGSIKVETIWQRLSDKSKKIILVNVPLTYPPYRINGCMITGLLTPSTRSDFTFPPHLSKEILDLEKDYAILTTQRYFNVMGLKRFLEKLKDTERKRCKVAKYLMNKYEWDLAMVHFHSSDILQHALYCYLDKNDARFDVEKYDLIGEFYKELDEHIASLWNEVPESSLKMVISDHGFGPLKKTIRLNNYLIAAGYAQLKKQNVLSRTLPFVMRLLRKADNFLVRFLLSPGKRAKIRRKINLDKIVSWDETKAFMLNGWVYGNIYLNCVEREKQGIVEFGEQYDKIRNEIAEKLMELSDPRTNEKVIKEIVKREDIYKGKNRIYAPDLIVIPEKGYEFNATFTGQSKDLFEENVIKKGNTGTHQKEGVFVIQGPSVKPHIDNLRMDIEDLYPTILFYFGLEIPFAIDGRVLTDLFEEEFLSNTRLKRIDDDIDISSSDEGRYSREDRELIAERLRDLGYID